jgi:metallophosphoesterase (TIGR00282 family)
VRILYIGDIVGDPGIETVAQVLPSLKAEKQINLVIAQAENVTSGKGISVADFRKLQKHGVDFCTGGNWTLHNQEVIQLLEDRSEPIIRPANYPEGTPGLGYKYIGDTLIVSLLGNIVGKDSEQAVDNPLKAIDQILEKEHGNYKQLVVNLHGDYSSEKVIIGHYLDGKATLVVGDHWHVPTADARILPGGTAHITDVGMCGALDASLGVTFDSVIPRWRDGRHTRNQLELSGQKQFNAVLVESDKNGLTKSIQQIQTII